MRWIFTLFFTLFLYFAGGCWVICSAAGVTIYFYNPETSIDNFVTLKTAFDSYLSTQGSYNFQPFDNQATFESAIKQQKKGNIYLLSSWHLDELQKQKIPLEIVLMGTSKGNSVQSKILSAKKEITDFNMLKSTTVAGAGSEEYIRNVLQKITKQKLPDNIKILSVPKDIDALMAVGFGVAAAAISAETSFTKLATINPNQHQQLHILGASEKSYFLVAATLEKPGKDEAQVLEILYKMAEKEAGQKSLNLLGLDGWKWK